MSVQPVPASVDLKTCPAPKPLKIAYIVWELFGSIATSVGYRSGSEPVTSVNEAPPVNDLKMCPLVMYGAVDTRIVSGLAAATANARAGFPPSINAPPLTAVHPDPEVLLLNTLSFPA